jgi:hypothetical protein
MFLDTHCLCLLELGDDGATIKRSAYQESDLREDDERSVSWAERADIVFPIRHTRIRCEYLPTTVRWIRFIPSIHVA